MLNAGMVYNMNESKKSFSIRDYHPAIQKKASLQSPMKAKKRGFNMGNLVSYSALLNRFTSFTDSQPKFKVPKMDGNKRKLSEFLHTEDNEDEDVIFIEKVPANMQREVPNLYDSKSPYTGLGRIFRGTLGLGQRFITKREDKWTIKDLVEENKSLLAKLENRTGSVVKKTTEGPTLDLNEFKTYIDLKKNDTKVAENHYENEIHQNYIHSRDNYKFDSSIAFRDCKPTVVDTNTFIRYQDKRQIVDEVPVLERPKPAFTVPEVTQNMIDEVEKATRQLTPIVTTPYKLMRTDLIKLYRDGDWLNDTVMDAYMMLIENEATANNRNVKCLTTFFFTRLSNGSVNDRFMRKVDFFGYDLILFPIHLASHWRLMAINVNEKTLSYYDSLHLHLYNGFEVVLEFLLNRSAKRAEGAIDPSEWNFINVDTPMQNNTYDCGVFALKYAHFLARGLPFLFTQKDIPHYRTLMSYELITTKLL